MAQVQTIGNLPIYVYPLFKRTTGLMSAETTAEDSSERHDSNPLSQNKLHVTHVVPLSEFASHLVEVRHLNEPEFTMQRHARLVRQGDARYEHMQPHSAGMFHKAVHKGGAYALSAHSGGHIYRHLGRGVVGFAPVPAVEPQKAHRNATLTTDETGMPLCCDGVEPLFHAKGVYGPKLEGGGAVLDEMVIYSAYILDVGMAYAVYLIT